jgi:hypothetical protein
MIEIAWQVMMGVGLAASAGLRAFLPLLVVGGAGRLELIELGEKFQWMAGTPALTVLAIAVVFELLADKIPVVDNVLDMAGTFVRPVAGAIAAASPLASLDPLTAVVVGIVLGGAVAGSVHVAKTGLRLGSTGATGGLANPVLSAAEDATSLAGSVLSIFLPVITFTAAVGIVYLVVRATRRRRELAPAGR